MAFNRISYFGWKVIFCVNWGLLSSREQIMFQNNWCTGTRIVSCQVIMKPEIVILKTWNLYLQNSKWKHKYFLYLGKICNYNIICLLKPYENYRNIEAYCFQTHWNGSIASMFSMFRGNFCYTNSFYQLHIFSANLTSSCNNVDVKIGAEMK